MGQAEYLWHPYSHLPPAQIGNKPPLILDLHSQSKLPRKQISPKIEVPQGQQEEGMPDGVVGHRNVLADRHEEPPPVHHLPKKLQGAHQRLL